MYFMKKYVRQLSPDITDDLGLVGVEGIPQAEAGTEIVRVKHSGETKLCRSRAIE